MLSAGGPTAGKCLTAPAGMRQAQFSDEIFAQILQWRVGIQGPRWAAGCRNVTLDGELCGETLDSWGDHAAACGCGPLRTLRHDGLAEELAECAAETGAHVRREAWIAELATPAADAILDVWAFGAASVADLLLDVTVCHPGAMAYQPDAASVAGSAAAQAAARKRERYPSRGGRSVTPFAVETWGRLDAMAEQVLDDLAAAATRHAELRGQAPTPGSCLRRWRASLDAALQSGVARMLIAARCGLPGRSLRARHAGAPATGTAQPHATPDL